MNSTKDNTHHQAIREAMTTSAAGIARDTSSAQSENTKLLPESGKFGGTESISPQPMNSKTQLPRRRTIHRLVASISKRIATPAKSSRPRGNPLGRRSAPDHGTLIDMNALESGLLKLLREASKS